MVQYQFSNSENWQLYYNTSVTAVSVPSAAERFYPIPPITPGLLFDAEWILINCHNPKAEPNWRFGARIYASISTGLVVNGGTPDTVIKVGKIYLNQNELIRIPPYSSGYSLTIEIPYWHRQFNVSIWQYTGNNQNTPDAKLDQILLNTSTP